ncbi:membrane protein [Gordonia phage RoyalG]|uniref:Membrane protein n=2 Tax=Montyvirus stevefrench TaxID=2734258 RepID=A0A890UXN3_9CAUD|nr:membrane protein [Gordonia phage RoyalG]
MTCSTNACYHGQILPGGSMTNNLPQAPGSVPVVGPNIFNIRSKNDFIGLLYYVIPLVMGILVLYGALDNNTALFWGGAATSLIQLVFQYTRTQEFARRAIYTVLNLINAGLLIYVAGWSPQHLENLMPLLALVLGGSAAGIASQNVNTSGDGTVVRVVEGSVVGNDPQLG